ncbi:hypothetical protein [Sporosarcina aquimarina]|uniref:Uncharacterized protein n=1 Tax=Sporosarcina aquimarina TaxID=114975 RepID=A0ABU4FW09_9BACL|nr:hypothetical protein [Sporosarcina aquimarina]MDW0108901.1 hypothetical protein [Sporosarcina aquimarina]
MYILVSSNYPLIADLLVTAFQKKRPKWRVNARASLAAFSGTTAERMDQYDVIIIETSYEQFSFYKMYVNELRECAKPVLFLTNENIGEISYHTFGVKNFHVLNKSISFNNLIEVIENGMESVVGSSTTQLGEQERSILRELAKGHTVDYIHKDKKITKAQVDEMISKINTHFETTNYLQALHKAYDQNYL